MIRSQYPFVSVIVLVSVGGCGDDNAPNNAPSTTDSGLDAAPALSAMHSASTSAQRDAGIGDTSADGGNNPCSSIASACAAFEDADGLGNLCLRVAADADPEQCGALNNECLTFCQLDAPKPVDAGSIGAEECDEMGDRCHDLDNGHGLGHLCHETGHTGNAVWCTAIYDECTALCGHLEHAEEDAASSDASEPDANLASDASLR